MINTKKLTIAFCINAVVFLIIAVVCIGFIFAPVKEYVQDQSGEVTVISWSSLDVQGGGIIANSWKKYPNYIIGLGTAAFLSFSGAVVSVYMADKLKREGAGDIYL